MKKILFATILAAVSVTACDVIPENVTPNDDKQDRQTLTINASDASATKTALGSDTKTVTWTAGDQLGVFCNYKPEGGDEANMTVDETSKFQFAYALDSSTAGTANGSFTGNIVADEATTQYDLRVYYPYSAANDTKKPHSATHTLPALQSYDAAATTHSFGSADFLMGRSGWFAGGTTSANITLRHAFVLMQFEIVNNTGAAIDVKNLRISTSVPDGVDAKVLSGTFTMDLGKNPITEREQAIKFEIGNPAVATGNPAVATDVTNCSIANGASKKVMLMMNPQDLTDCTTTIAITTSSKTYTIDLGLGGGIDFLDKYISEGKNNFTKTLTLTTETPSAAIDNYDPATMFLLTPTTAKQFGELEFGKGVLGGKSIICVEGFIDTYTGLKAVANTVRVGGDLTFIGRHVDANGNPVDTLSATFAFAAKMTAEHSASFRNLNLTSRATNDGAGDIEFIRFKNALHDVSQMLFDNCIFIGKPYVIDETTLRYPINAATATKVIKNLTVRNCIFANWRDGAITYGSATGDAVANIASVTIENNTFYSANEFATSIPFIFTGGNIKMTNNTVYNYAATGNSLITDSGTGTMVFDKNVVATTTAAASTVFASSYEKLTGTETNFLYNYSLLGGTQQTESVGTFDTTNGFTYTPSAAVKTAGAGDPRWNN